MSFYLPVVKMHSQRHYSIGTRPETVSATVVTDGRCSAIDWERTNNKKVGGVGVA